MELLVALKIMFKKYFQIQNRKIKKKSWSYEPKAGGYSCKVFTQMFRNYVYIERVYTKIIGF